MLSPLSLRKTTLRKAGLDISVIYRLLSRGKWEGIGINEEDKSPGEER